MLFTLLCFLSIGIFSIKSAQSLSLSHSRIRIFNDADAVTFKADRNCSIKIRSDLKLSLFPKDFVWGAGVSAGQVEGAAFVDGRTASSWDLYTQVPGRILDGSNASVSCDSYSHYKDDLDLVKAMNMNSYRFSISWSRLFPRGGSEINPLGLQYYNNLIEYLVAKGIEPLVTLHHMDLPAEVDDHGGWLNASIIERYGQYAEECFKHFGGRVKRWATLNEPYHMAVFEYSNGEWPPARCSDRSKCGEGNGPVESYAAMHNMLLAHARIVHTYRTKYQGRSGGQIGMNLEGPFYYPISQSPENVAAAERAFTWRLLWAWEPVYTGDYPSIMRDRLGPRLPVFTEEEKSLLRGSADYFGLNFYTASYVMSNIGGNGGYDAQTEADGQYSSVFTGEDGTWIGEQTGFFFRPSVPKSMYDMLMWLTARYPEIPIVVAENGYPAKALGSVGQDTQLCDVQRTIFFQDYLANALKAVQNGANLKGYYVWSLLDSFEWDFGYTVLHGLVYVDFNDPKRSRYPRASHKWWTGFLRGDFDTLTSST